MRTEYFPKFKRTKKHVVELYIAFVKFKKFIFIVIWKFSLIILLYYIYYYIIMVYYTRVSNLGTIWKGMILYEEINWKSENKIVSLKASFSRKWNLKLYHYSYTIRSNMFEKYFSSIFMKTKP